MWSLQQVHSEYGRSLIPWYIWHMKRGCAEQSVGSRFGLVALISAKGVIEDFFLGGRGGANATHSRRSKGQGEPCRK